MARDFRFVISRSALIAGPAYKRCDRLVIDMIGGLPLRVVSKVVALGISLVAVFGHIRGVYP